MPLDQSAKVISGPKIASIPVAVIIPAYQPGRVLVDLVKALNRTEFCAIVVADDGSGPDFLPVFDALRGLAGVFVIRHAVNLGKGAALKTGMNYALVEFPGIAGVVTADADGQHDPADIVSVARVFAGRPDAVVIGSREFASDIPLRSRLGNLITRRVMRLLVGTALSDTQSGLRAVPRELTERLLRIPASGYEFELEMLIAARHLSLQVIEEPIRTIYEPGNPSSHFQPLRDSMRIYFVLLRFTFISLTTAGLDNLAFYLLFHASGRIAASLIGARILALTFNYALVRSAVFHSGEPHRIVLPRYLILGASYACVSYLLITFISTHLPFGVVPAKMMAESFLFIASFAIQRDFVFARRSIKAVS